MKKILLSAYCCSPHRGSEHGIGWNTAVELARRDRVWVLAAEFNRAEVEAELARNPNENLTFVFHRAPGAERRLTSQFTYGLWQCTAYGVAQRLHREIGFDLTQHVSFVRYWMPSPLAFLPAPFVWGPVGGREPAPLAFDYGAYGTLFELLRRTTLALADLNPLLWIAARRSHTALAVSRETERHLRRLGARRTALMACAGVSPDVWALPEAAADGGPEAPAARGHGPVDGGVHRTVFACVSGPGRLLHWKGFHLGIRALAAAELDDAELHVFGSGRQMRRLQRMANDLGVGDRVVFWGDVPRDEMLTVLRRSAALVHPAVRDAGPTVIPEALALGKPVLCLDIGGPALQVDHATGFKAPADEVDRAVTKLAHGMRVLANDPELRRRMGEACRRRASDEHAWRQRGRRLREVHARVVQGEAGRGGSDPEETRAAYVDPRASSTDL